MTLKTYIRHALKVHSAPVAGLLILILVLSTVLSLTPNARNQKKVTTTTAIPAKKELIKERIMDVPKPAEWEPEDKRTGAVAMTKGTAPQRQPSEIKNPKAVSPDENSLEPAVESSPEQLVYMAESAFARDLGMREKLAAIRSLEDINDPMVVDPVMIAMDDEDPVLRRAALEVIRDLDHEEINEVFQAGMEDDNQAVTDKAMEIIADGDSPNILPSLERALISSDENIQKIAILTLEDISDVRAIDLLIDKGLQDPDETIRGEVIDSLEFITSQRFESHQDAKIWWELNRDIFEFD
jgi:HEAT repeat protein